MRDERLTPEESDDVRRPLGLRRVLSIKGSRNEQNDLLLSCQKEQKRAETGLKPGLNPLQKAGMHKDGNNHRFTLLTLLDTPEVLPPGLRRV